MQSKTVNNNLCIAKTSIIYAMQQVYIYKYMKYCISNNKEMS